MAKRPHRGSSSGSSNPTAALEAADPIITIDVGGRQFRSYRSTLTKYDSKVKYILNGRLPGLIADATVFLDLSPTHFDILLDFMRHDRLLLPSRFEDAEFLRLRHAAEQLWLFECLRAVDRWEAGGGLDARSEPDLGERKPTRYVQIRLQQEQPLTVGAALSAVPINGSLTAGFGVTDRLHDILGPAADIRGGSSSQRLRSADQVRAFLEAAQAALEGLGGARVFADGRVAPGSPVNFVEIYAVPEADESSLPLQASRTPPNPAWPPSPSPLSPSAWPADPEPPLTPPGSLSVDYYHPPGNGSDLD